MYWGEFRAYVNSIMLLLFFLAYNLLSGNSMGFWENLSRSLMVTSTALVTIALVLGPLSRFFPKKFTHDLLYRKPLAYSGAVMAFMYFLIALVAVYRLDILAVFSGQNPDFIPWIFWALAMLILAGLAVASLPYFLNSMGFSKWKMLQATGYYALLFMLLHISMLNAGFFLATISGKTILAFGFIAIGLKFLSILLAVQKKHSQKEIEILLRE